MTLVERRPTRRTARGSQVLVGLLLALGLLLTACGMNAQTLQPYTPAEGVNADVGPDNGPKVHLRNLMVLSREEGVGYLSATLSADDRDTLSSISGMAITSDGAEGAALTVAQPDPISFGSGSFVVLTNRSLIEVRSEDLAAGLTAEMTLMFSTSGSVTLRVPVVDANQSAYVTITPTPTPTP